MVLFQLPYVKSVLKVYFEIKTKTLRLSILTLYGNFIMFFRLETDGDKQNDVKSTKTVYSNCYKKLNSILMSEEFFNTYFLLVCGSISVMLNQI